MKMIKVTTDLKLTEHEFPSGTIAEQNRFLRELIGSGCDIYERVMPKRLYQELGMENTPTRIPGQCVSMLVDEEGLLKENIANPAGCYLYGTDEHGHPIMGNVLFVGEEWTSGGIGFCGIEESVFQELKAKLESVADTLSKARRCPRCGNMGIAPDHKFCSVCGLELKRKEKAPEARQSTSGDSKKPQPNDTPNGENCQTEERGHGQKQN